MRQASKVIANNEFLAGMRGRHLAEVLRAAETRKVDAREIILREGAPPTHLFLLKTGQVRFYRLTDGGEEVLLSMIRPGDVFGLSNLLVRPMPYVGTAETRRDSDLLVWEQSHIRKLAEKYPRLSQNALGIALRYLARHFDRLFALVACTSAQRVAGLLMHLGSETGALLPDGAEITVTNTELAAEANVSPFTVSRLVQRWARTGALRKKRGKLVILSPEKLIAPGQRR